VKKILIREGCKDVDRPNLFSNIREKISLIYYCEIKRKWGKENYINECTRKERMGILLLNPGIWKLRGIRRGSDRGRCPLCLGEENTKHILMKCPKQTSGEKNLYAING
jgi:hypothetical protein